jgi:hypothetical protein
VPAVRSSCHPWRLEECHCGGGHVGQRVGGEEKGKSTAVCTQREEGEEPWESRESLSPRVKRCFASQTLGRANAVPETCFDAESLGPGSRWGARTAQTLANPCGSVKW